jgi:hypothetical protein
MQIQQKIVVLSSELAAESAPALQLLLRIECNHAGQKGIFINQWSEPVENQVIDLGLRIF